MTEKTPRKLFVNVCVKNLEASKAFFAALGFTFHPAFTNERAASMIVNDSAYVMLIDEPMFATFTKRALCNRETSVEAIYAFSVDSREEVDAVIQKAFDAGAKDAMPPQDHGFMYLRSFFDLDGHHWEVFWMDPNAAPHA
jgi:hypothetical protein